MNPYQIVGIIAGCSFAFAAVVATLAMQGMPVLMAFAIVYLVALVAMIAMQRRAGQSCDGATCSDERDASWSASRANGSSRRSGTRFQGRDQRPAARGVGGEPMRIVVGDVRF